MRPVVKLAVAVLLSWLLTALSHAQPPSSADPAVQFRRIYFPENRAQELRNQGRYLPKDPAEFERMVASLKGSVLASASQTTIARAQYQAQLVAADVLTGEALLDIQHDAAGGHLLPLEPFGLALHKGVWSQAAASPAMLGAGPDGRFFVKVDGPGKLRLEWSLRGAPDATGVMAFQLEVPSCPVSSLELRLPSKLVPVVSNGVVQPETEADPALRRWRITLGPAARFELKLLEREGEAARGGGVARQKVHYDYDLAPRGLQVTAVFQLEIERDPIHELELAFDSQLQILRIMDEGQRSLPWSVSSTRQEGVSRAIVSLAEPFEGPHHSIAVRAAMPVQLGASWALPGLSLPGLTWQQGDALLTVFAPLVIEHLVTRECRQSLASTMPAPGIGEIVELQYFTPQPQVELRLGRRQGRVRMSSGAEIRLERGDVQGKTIAQLSIDEGECHEIEAELLPGWNIENVDSLPPQEISDWAITSLGDSKRLKIRFSRPLSPQRPVWIVCTGSRARAAFDERIEIGSLAMWNVAGVDAVHRFMSLAAAEPYELRLDGDADLTPLAPERLTDGEQALLFDSVSGIVFELAPSHLKVGVSLREAKPQFSAELEVNATCTPGLLAEAYRLRCVPALNPIDRIHVRFSPARAVAPRWSLGPEGENTRSIVGRKLPSPPAGEAGETWELTLPEPLSTPFEIHAARAMPLNAEQAISLASLPDAAAQTGSLSVRAAPDVGLSIRNRRLKPIPTAPGGQRDDLRMAFHYEPQDAGALADSPLLVSTSEDGVTLPAALIWRCSVDVYVEPEGHSQHTATYWVQNFGCGQLVVPFSPSVRLGKVMVDQSEVSADRTPEHLTVPLPVDRPFSTISVRWTRPTAGIYAWTAYETEIPLPTDLPVLSRSQTVFVPRGFSVSRAEDGASSGLAQPTIARRLFGPLARPAGTRPWNPLTEDWRMRLGFDVSRDSNLQAPAIDAAGQQWRAESPWDRAEEVPRAAYAVGWQSYRFDGAASTLRVIIIRDRLMQAIGWAVLLMAAAGAWWQSSRRLTRVVAAAGLLAATALLVPAPVTPLTSGAFLGTLLGVFAWIAAPVLPRSTSAVGGNYPSSMSAAARLAGSMAIGGLLVWGALAVAQEPPPLPQATNRSSPTSQPLSVAVPTTTYHVFVPADDQDQPTGGRYLVPEGLWQRLVTLASRVSSEPKGSLIELATYRQSLTWDPAIRRLQAGNMAATYQLQVLGQPPRVQLPMGRLAGAIALDTLRLDGLPVDSSWEEEGQVLAFDAGQPGAHQLEFVLHPTPRQLGSTTGFETPLLPVAASHLELSLPAGAPAVDVTSAFGNVMVEPGTSRLVAALGPTDRLAVRWRDAAADPASSTPVFDVHELLWLKVQSNSVVLNARLLLNVTTGSVNSIQFLADPHLRRLPLDQDDPLVSEVRTDPNDPRRRELILSRPVSGQEQIELKFLLTDASGVGVLQAPTFGVQQGRHRQRWLAVSVAPTLQATVDAGEGAGKLTPGDFASKWGMSEEKPAFAYQLQDGELQWRLATRPIEARRVVDQVTTISAGADMAQLRCQAELEVSGHCFQHRLSAPRELVIDSLSVLEQGVERLAHWSRDGDGNVVVFLTADAQGRQAVELRGRMPVAGGALQLPRIALQADVVRSDEVRIYRQTSALLELQNVTDLQEVTGPVLSEDAELGRLVHRLAVIGPNPSARLGVTVNGLDCHGVQVTSLHYVPEQDAWDLQVEVELRVVAGVVDAVRLAIPSEWTGPHTLSAPFAAELRHDSGDSARLVVRPDQAISDHARFVLRGRFSPGQGAPLSVPAVSILEDFNVRQFLDLPAQNGLEQFAWDIRGLQPATLPPGFQHLPPGDTSDEPERTTYQVVRDDYRAVKTSVPASSEFPEVTLADYRVAYREDGWLGSAVFDCIPGERSTCRLVVPANCRIVACRVAGRPAVAVAEEPQLWRLELGMKRLPQRIELVFFSAATAGPAALSNSLEVPRLRDLPVRATLWTVSAPSEVEPQAPAERRRSHWDHERIRLQSAASTVADAVAIAADEPADEVQAWYAHWAQPLMSARDALSQLLATRRLGAQRQRTAEALSTTLKQHASIEQRLNVRLPQPEDDAARVARQQPALLWDWTTNGALTASTFVVPGESTVLRFDRRDEASRDLGIRWSAAVCLLLATGLAVLSMNRGWAQNWGRRWPHAWAAAFGLSWWLWLSPSVLGWVWLALIPLLARPVTPQPKRDLAGVGHER